MFAWMTLWLAPRLDRVIDDQLADVSLAGTVVSAQVMDPRGRVIHTDGADRRLVPASTLKWIVAVAAADRLGLDHRFETRLGVTGYLDGSVLHGDLVWIGGGDPSLGESDPEAVLAHAIAPLLAAGIEHVAGRIVVDPSIVVDPPLGAGWMWDDLQYGFSAPFGGLNLGHNLKGPGMQACAGQGGAGRPVSDPADCAGVALVAALEGAGIAVSGGSAVEAAPLGATDLVTWSSAPLGELLGHMLLDSDNLYAECISRALDPAPGRTFAGARSVLNDVLVQAGVDDTAIRLSDGSGLSRYSMISAEGLVVLTGWALERPWGTDLVARLPIAGECGTLEGRCVGRPAHGRIYGKTGSMTGVRNVVGIAYDADDRPLPFALLFNGVGSPQGPAIAVQDRIFDLLAVSQRGRVRRRDRVAVTGEGG